MLLAKSFSVLVEPVKETSTTIVTTERSFILSVQSFTGTSSVQTTNGVSIQPVKSVTCTSSVQTTAVVIQISSSQPLSDSSSGQISGPVNQPASVTQLTDVPSAMSVVKATGQVTAAHGIIGATNVQITRPVSQSVTSKKGLPSLSLTGTAYSLDWDSDIDQYSETTSHEQDLNQEVSEEQTYQGNY